MGKIVLENSAKFERISRNRRTIVKSKMKETQHIAKQHVSLQNAEKMHQNTCVELVRIVGFLQNLNFRQPRTSYLVSDVDELVMEKASANIGLLGWRSPRRPRGARRNDAG